MPNLGLTPLSDVLPAGGGAGAATAAAADVVPTYHGGTPVDGFPGFVRHATGVIFPPISAAEAALWPFADPSNLPDDVDKDGLYIEIPPAMTESIQRQQYDTLEDPTALQTCPAPLSWLRRCDPNDHKSIVARYLALMAFIVKMAGAHVGEPMLLSAAERCRDSRHFSRRHRATASTIVTKSTSTSSCKPSRKRKAVPAALQPLVDAASGHGVPTEAVPEEAAMELPQAPPPQTLAELMAAVALPPSLQESAPETAPETSLEHLVSQLAAEPPFVLVGDSRNDDDASARPGTPPWLAAALASYNQHKTPLEDTVAHVASAADTMPTFLELVTPSPPLPGFKRRDRASRAAGRVTSSSGGSSVASSLSLLRAPGLKRQGSRPPPGKRRCVDAPEPEPCHMTWMQHKLSTQENQSFAQKAGEGSMGTNMLSLAAALANEEGVI